MTKEASQPPTDYIVPARQHSGTRDEVPAQMDVVVRHEIRHLVRGHCAARAWNGVARGCDIRRIGRVR